MFMIDINLGKIILGSNVYRDAIHIAVAPVFSAMHIHAGQTLTLVKGTTNQVIPSIEGEAPIGIADPFFPNGTDIHPNTRFWMLLYPKTITSLRHEWSHPAFDIENIKETELKEAENRIRYMAESFGLSKEELLIGAQKWVERGEYLNKGGLLESKELPDDFWHYYEIFTGQEISNNRKKSFFTCSC